jgi:hypothetical protein
MCALDWRLDGSPVGDRLFIVGVGPDIPAPAATGSWPRIEISETESEMKVTAELPGLDEKDVQVELVRSVVRRKQRRKIRTGCSANSSLARALSRIECGDFRYKRLPSQKIWMGGKALLLQPSLIRVVGR